MLVGLCGPATVALAVASPQNELTTNGDFELGNTSSWTSFPTQNSTFTITMDANSGSFAGQLVNPDPAAGAVIKQANLGVGIVSPGDVLQVSFAAKGTFMAGGIAFAEFFSELAGGGTSASVFLGGGPLNLTNNWQTFNFMTVAGPNVSGGVTLQIAAITGANIGSFAEVFIDDVSVRTAMIGTNYCTANPNSRGLLGAISVMGSDIVANNDLTLVADNLPLNVFGIFTTSMTQGFVANPNGSAGNLCLSGTIGRYMAPNQIRFSGASGSFSLVLDLTMTPTPTSLVSVAAGETWNFQAWHRDVGAGAPSSNFTNGISVLFR